MSDQVAETIEKSRQKVSLTTCFLNSLRTNRLVSTSTSCNVVEEPPPEICDSLIALLQHIRHAVTTLALAMKPPVTAAAVAPQLTKVEDLVARMVSCCEVAATCNPYLREMLQDSTALLEIWIDSVHEICVQVNILLATLRDDARSGDAATKVAKDVAAGQAPYLAQTGLVWAAIDSFKVLRYELEAVEARWDGQKATVRDAWAEFKEMMEDDGENNDDGFGGIEEEWAELENVGGKMSSSELARAEAVKPLLGLHQILHVTLSRNLDVLSTAPQLTYHGLTMSGKHFVAAFDAAVSSMYPKQDIAEINTAIETLNAKASTMVVEFEEKLEQISNVGYERDPTAVISFIKRWKAKFVEENRKWEEKRMGVSELAEALQ